MSFGTTYSTIISRNCVVYQVEVGVVGRCGCMLLPWCEPGHHTVLANASGSGSWREGKLDQRDAPVFEFSPDTHCWMCRGEVGRVFARCR